jgi:hypothetical protein
MQVTPNLDELRRIFACQIFYSLLKHAANIRPHPRPLSIKDGEGRWTQVLQSCFSIACRCQYRFQFDCMVFQQDRPGACHYKWRTFYFQLVTDSGSPLQLVGEGLGVRSYCCINDGGLTCVPFVLSTARDCFFRLPKMKSLNESNSLLYDRLVP